MRVLYPGKRDAQKERANESMAGISARMRQPPPGADAGKRA